MTAEKCAKTWERVCEKSMWCWQLIKLRLNQQYFQSQFCCCWCRLFYYLFRAFKELFFIHIWEGLYVPHAHNCTNKYTFWQDNSMHEYAQAERKTRLEITGAINLYIYICIATYSEWDIEGYNTRPNDCPAGVCVCVCVCMHTYPHSESMAHRASASLWWQSCLDSMHNLLELGICINEALSILVGGKRKRQ